MRYHCAAIAIISLSAPSLGAETIRYDELADLHLDVIDRTSAEVDLSPNDRAALITYLESL